MLLHLKIQEHLKSLLTSNYKQNLSFSFGKPSNMIIYLFLYIDIIIRTNLVILLYLNLLLVSTVVNYVHFSDVFLL